MNVFENVYAYLTESGWKGIVRADSEKDAKSRVSDFYRQEEVKAVVLLDPLDNDHGVVPDVAIDEEIRKKTAVRQYAIDVVGELNTCELMNAIENAFGVSVLGAEWKATWTLDDYRHGRKPIASD